MSRPRAVTIHLAFWTIYGLVHYLAVLPAIAPYERLAMAVASAIRSLTGLIVSSTLWRPLERVVRSDRRAWRIVSAAAVAAIGLFLWPVFDRIVLTGLATAFAVEIPWIRFPRGLDLGYVLVLIAWWSGASALLLSGRERETREALLEQRAATRDAQLSAIGARLNPHFLFNSLNMIRSLIAEDTERARAMVSRLSDFLRHALELDLDRPATLEQELASAQAYLRISEVRFEPDLCVEVEMDQAAGDILLPPLLLQPLVENAIMHGKPTPSGRIVIRVTAVTEGERLVIRVANSGVLTNSAAGVGLQLSRSRLRHMYGDSQRLELVQEGDRIVAVVEIEAPLRNGSTLDA